MGSGVLLAMSSDQRTSSGIESVKITRTTHRPSNRRNENVEGRYTGYGAPIPALDAHYISHGADDRGDDHRIRMRLRCLCEAVRRKLPEQSEAVRSGNADVYAGLR